MRPIIIILSALVGLLLVVSCAPAPADRAPSSTPTSNPEPAGEPTESSKEPTAMPEYEIVDVLPRDAIRAIFEPEFLSIEQADERYAPDELVLGVEIDGDARAYSIPYLSGHEIVNDTVGGVHLAVTW